MRRKRWLFAAAAAVLCCILAGCSDLSLNARDLLSPPKAQGAQAELQTLIDSRIGSVYTPVYPTAGEWQNAVITRDTDGDGFDEAIALCRGRDANIHILAIRGSDDGYHFAGEGKVPGDLIEQVEFADLDGDGQEEFILLYPDADTARTSLTVMPTDGSSAQSDMPACCSKAIIGDFDAESGSDILLLTRSDSVDTASADLLGYADGALIVCSSCEMDPDIEEYTKITYGCVSEGVNAAFVDGCTPSGEYTTQILCCDPADGTLHNPLFLYAGYEGTRRIDRISSSDVDRDGLIELPVCSLCDYGVKEPVETVCRRLTWNNYDIADMALISKKTAVLCEEQGFLFNISSERVGAVTARRPDADTVVLFLWEFRGDAMQCTDRLLTIRRFDKDSFDPDSAPAPVLCETDASVYTCDINAAAGALGYTFDEAQSCLVPIEN